MKPISETLESYEKQMFSRTVKKEYKTKVLAWLAENSIFPKEVRVYDTRRYGLEVRIYHGATEFPNMRRSFRRESPREDENGKIVGWDGTRGIHSRRINLYTAINEESLSTKEEKEYTLRCLRDNL